MVKSRNPESLHLPTASSHTPLPHTQPLCIFPHDGVAWLCFGLPAKPTLLPGQHPATVSRPDARERSGLHTSVQAKDDPRSQQLLMSSSRPVHPPFGDAGPREAGRGLPTLACHLRLNRGIGARGHLSV